MPIIKQKDDEIERLRAALFEIQCDQLDRATNTALSARHHREMAMATRANIIAILRGSAVSSTDGGGS